MEKTLLQGATVRMENLFKERGRFTVPKGEIWLGAAFLDSAGFADTVDNHFRLATQLGQDMVSLPVSEKPQQNLSLGYRYFQPAELGPHLRDRSQILAAVIDGPFQRMVNRRGLLAVLMAWVQDQELTMASYAAEGKIALELIDCCLENGFDAIVLADDMAGEQGPLVNPLTLESICSPFYLQAVSAIRKVGAFALLHCCGNLTKLVPMIQSWNLDGLAAIQICKNDLSLLTKEVGGLLLAGIEAALLEKKAPSSQEIEELKRFVSSFSRQQRLILCSSCGLYTSDFWGRLQYIYAELDKDSLASQSQGHGQ